MSFYDSCGSKYKYRYNLAELKARARQHKSHGPKNMQTPSIGLARTTGVVPELAICVPRSLVVPDDTEPHLIWPLRTVRHPVRLALAMVNGMTCCDTQMLRNAALLTLDVCRLPAEALDGRHASMKLENCRDALGVVVCVNNELLSLDVTLLEYMEFRRNLHRTLALCPQLWDR